ncbi:DUF6597 domain-containing transcriptional factor [Chitinophaga solisilvae]|uniref:DUF6597 domain-containing transcriptional factor n=1 Tax=Chitinophaga solisilvae TaxID=1233460 RepID=UPI001F3D7B8F|nr:DUF6597 domain-containing transcriptional factor [Chitinophaga solisilvae]
MQAVEIIDQQYFSSQYRYIAPSADLARHVVCYWLLDLRQPQLHDDEFREILMANMYSSLVLNMGAPFEIYDRQGRFLHASNSSELIGYHTMPVSYRHHSNNFLVGIKFKPASLNYLFHIKGADLHRHTLPAADALRHISRLENAVYDAKGLPAINNCWKPFSGNMPPSPPTGTSNMYCNPSTVPPSSNAATS